MVVGVRIGLSFWATSAALGERARDKRLRVGAADDAGHRKPPTTTHTYTAISAIGSRT
jgi:hypothetical protein